MNILPIEIAEEILSKCSQNALTRVARISRLFCTLSEKILYANIHLDTAEYTHAVALRGCLRTLSGCIQKADHVKMFDLYIFKALQESELDDLCAALVRMNNLKFLSLDMESYHASALQNIIKNALSRSSFSLSALRIPSMMKCDSWIASQQYLEALVISDYHEAWAAGVEDETCLRALARRLSPLKKNIFVIKNHHGWPNELITLPQTSFCWTMKQATTTRLFAFSQFISVLYVFLDSILDIQWSVDLYTEVSLLFPAIQTLVLVTGDKDLEQIMNSSDITRMITAFSKLRLLRMCSWDGECYDIACQETSLLVAQS
ncbi:hypothetical protein GGU10DRAFT_434406 [Lentinula aff. detonsa]|uniref:F-box domain-containing protein n=1 Tax=Lentinula aff. detonsa TaxID=2804958 RepID=A0AA38KSC7_9AGAR|nr:hypothetical protein GGU10DRAFT_434406 [Lentinula aff. detonsa]